MHKPYHKFGGALLLVLLLLGVTFGISAAQGAPSIQYRLVYIGNNTYEVRMLPQDVPSDSMVGGQVTIVTPAGAGGITNVTVPEPFVSRGARWSYISELFAPSQSPTYDYFTYFWDPTFAAGASAAYRWNTEGVEVVAFTFQALGGCPAAGPLMIVDNDTDPYINAAPPPDLDIANNIYISDPSAPIQVFDGLYTGPAGAIEADCRAVPAAPTVVTPPQDSTIITNTPLITGTVPVTSNVTGITVTDALGNVICFDTLDPDIPETTWSCTPTSPLPEGLNELEVVATNRGGTDGPATPFSFTVDTTPPTITGPTSGGVITGTPTISGTGAPSTTITVTDEPSGTVICTATVDASGNWSCTPTTPLTEGPHNLVATPTDPAGNIGTPSDPVTVTVDTTAPIAPIITGPTSGSVITGTPMISGTGEPSATVTVTDENGNVLCTATVDAGGNWSCTPTTPLTEGPHTLKATQMDEAGNESPASTPVNVTVDTTPPTQPTITGPTSGSVITGTPPISGTGEPSTTVTVTDEPSGTVICTATVDASGNWSCTPTTPLPEGSHNLVATPTDPAGNTGTPSDPVTVTVDTTAPAAPVITEPAPSAIISDTTPTITGTGEPGATVDVTDENGDPVCSATVDASGNWSCTPTTPLTDGAHTLTPVQTDPAGNESPTGTSVPFTIDSTPPAAPVITAPTDGSSTTDTTPTITGTGEPGATVDVTDGNGDPVCSATVDASGNWSCTPTTPLDPGPTRITAIVTDPAGNESQSATIDITIVFAQALDLKVYLTGAYAGSTLMRDSLRTLATFPTTDPYSQAPYASKFTHVGGGGETIGSGVLSVTGSDAIVDWVFIELRSTTSNVVATKSALVQRDGNVVEANDGVSMISFNVAPGNYYVVVRHRNHLGVMTANPVVLGASTAVIDFTLGVGVYGGGGLASQASFGTSFGLRPGDVDGDGVVKYSGAPNDLAPLRNSFFVENNTTGSLNYAGPEVTNVYSRADVSMDGLVRNATDVPVVRNSVLQHPDNTGQFLNSTQVRTKLPTSTAN